MNLPSTRALALFCCLLSLVASCNQEVLARALDAYHGAALTGVGEVEPETPDDDGDMLVCRSLPESQREETKQRRTAPASVEDGSGDASCWQPFVLLQHFDSLSGGQHAFRNGVGAPLLC